MGNTIRHLALGYKVAQNDAAMSFVKNLVVFLKQRHEESLSSVLPMVRGSPLDLFALFNAVKTRGGARAVRARPAVQLHVKCVTWCCTAPGEPGRQVAGGGRSHRRR